MIPVARRELHESLRNHWLQGYAVLLAGAGIVLSWTAASTSAGLGLQAFGRTTAGLTNLCLLLAPLVALALGAAAIAGERDRGTLERLLAQPYRRRDLLLGKYVGLAGSLLAATLAGFLPAAVVSASFAGVAVVGRLAIFPGVAALVILALLGVGFTISVHSRTSAQAQARAVFVWFCFVMLYDLLLLGTLMSARVGPGLLAILLIANPVSAGRVLVVLSLEADLYLLGPAGGWLVDQFGRAGAAALLVGVLVAWAGIALLAAVLGFRLRRPRRTGVRGSSARGVPARPVSTPQHPHPASTERGTTMASTAQRTLTTLLAVGLAASVAGACGSGSTASTADPDAPVTHVVDAGMLQRGNEVYTRNCAPCHGPLGKGDGPASATLNPKPRDHSDSTYMDTLSDQRIADTVRMGGAMSGYPNMPSSPHIRGDDLVALVAFVRTLGRGSDGVASVALKPQ